MHAKLRPNRNCGCALAQLWVLLLLWSHHEQASGPRA